MTSLHLVAGLRSVAGRHHDANQDSAGHAGDYAFVADGVGGHAAGDVASRAVCHDMMRALAGFAPGAVTAEDLRAALVDVNARLGERVRADPGLTGMATTFTGLFCGDGVVRVLHVGDSRAYLARDGTVTRVTTDDSPVQMLVDSGAIDEAAARHHPLRHVVLRCLSGAASDARDVSLQEVPARPGDRWLLTSDGLTDALPDDVVVPLLRDAPDPAAAARALVDAAQSAGARDDVTVVVCDVAAGPPSDRVPRLVGAAAEQDVERA